MSRTIFFAVAILLCWPFGASAADLTGRASVIDGDTLEIHGQRILLFGIDAPETRQTCEAGGQVYACGKQAALALADHIGQRMVACEQRTVDRYGRLVAICHVGGEDLSAWLVSQGLALAYRKYAIDYVDEETAAHSERLGIWRGTFAAPWDWRVGQWTPNVDVASGSIAEPQTPATCCKPPLRTSSVPFLRSPDPLR